MAVCRNQHVHLQEDTVILNGQLTQPKLQNTLQKAPATTNHASEPPSGKALGSFPGGRIIFSVPCFSPSSVSLPSFVVKGMSPSSVLLSEFVVRSNRSAPFGILSTGLWASRSISPKFNLVFRRFPGKEEFQMKM